MKENLNHNKSFYPFVKKKLNVLVNEKIYDKQNREKFPDDFIDFEIEKNNNRYVKEAIEYTANFPNSKGSTKARNLSFALFLD